MIWDAISVVPFEQWSVVDYFTKNTLSQQSTSSAYTSVKFSQREYLFGGDIAFFTQQSSTTYWAKLGIFRQIQYIETPAQTTVIKRTA